MAHLRRLRYVNSYLDRHGRPRHYFRRRKGEKQIPLPGPFGSEAFMRAYQMALMGSGILALRQGQPLTAVDQFMHAVKIAPDDVNVLLLAQALRRAGRVSEADSAFAQVQKVSSDLGRAQNAAAKLLSLVGLKPL